MEPEQLDSERRPQFVASLARRLAELGRLHDLGTLRYRPGRRPATAANSAYRVAALNGSWEAPELPPVDGPLLLVDDVTDTGWTLTMSSRGLRQAGAPVVLPFAVASVT